MGEARALVERFYQAFKDSDFDTALECFSEDIENIDPTGTIRGRAAFRAYLETFKRASPDAELRVTTWVESGDIAVVEGTYAGTFTGPLASPAGDIPPTGKSYELPYAELNEVRDGLIASHRVYYDQMTFLSALGVMPAQGGAAGG
jgi:steroid delta-isomerase-like uncharacterized protein